MSNKIVFRAAAKNFCKIPGSPIAYWVGKKAIKVFENPTVESCSYKVCKGCFTGDNDKYLRWWYEVSLYDQIKTNIWHRYSKGGAFRRWYGNSQHVIFWNGDGKTLMDFPKSGMGAAQYYGKCHIVWSGISTGLASFRLDDKEVYFDDVSPAVIFTGDVDYRMLCALNAVVIAELLKIVAPTMHFQAGDIKLLPICKSPCNEKCIELARTLVKLSRSDWDEYETSWDFKVNPLVREGWQRNGSAMSLESAWAAVFARRMEWAARMKALEEENNRLFIKAYGLEGELKPDVEWKDVSITGNPFYRYKVDGEVGAAGAGRPPYQGVPEELEAKARADAMRELLSYGMGVLMGRYSLEQEGLILASQGETYKDYIERVHGAGKILPDDDGIIPAIALDGSIFQDNLLHRMREFLSAAFGNDALPGNLNFIEEALGCGFDKYLTDKFFDDHAKTYRKRPIYWLFESPKGYFRAFAYMHRMTGATAGLIRNKYLLSYIEHLERTFVAESAKGAAMNGAERRRVKEIEKAIADCKAYDLVLHDIAEKSIAIDLDDGVVVNWAKYKSVLAKI